MISKPLKTYSIELYTGLVATFIGLVAFTVSWNMWEVWQGPMPGYQFFLFPGNLTLVYIWHPLFTEELNFWPKLFLLLLGQFLVVAFCVGLLRFLVKKLPK